MVYTSSSGLKKRKKNEGKGEEKNTHADCGRCALSSLGLLVERDEYWSEVAPFKGEREGENPPTITLPSSDSFERSQPGRELYL